MLDIPLDDRVVAYHALSYTWGNPIPDTARRNPWVTERVPPSNHTPRSIYVNRQKLDVTANLFFALKRLHPRFENNLLVPCLWVDAICINQGDLVERAEQVKLMGDIYRNAEDVLVWLGEEEGETDSDMALDLLNNVYYSFIQWGNNDEEAQSLVEQLEREAENLKLDTRMASTGVPLGETNNYVANMFRLQTLWIQRSGFSSLDVRCDARAWAAVERLLERAWFTRLWTYQEKALARSATLLVGGKSISWVNLTATMGLVSNHDNTEGRAKLLPKGHGRRFFESSQPSEADMLTFGGAHQNMFEVVRTARSRGCKDPRDKIYGVLSTMSPQDAGYRHIFGMLDYETTSVQDLYIEFARFYLENMQDLRILLSCSCYPSPMDGLPSWAPDWSKPIFGAMLPDRAYHAAQQSEPIIEYRPDRREMLLLGVAIDRIRLLVPLTQSTMADIIAMEESEQVEAAQNQIGQFLFLYLAHQNANFQRLLEGKWIDLANSIKWDEPYPTGNTYAEAYWRTLIGDMDPNAFAHVFKLRASQDLSITDWVDRVFGDKPLPSDFEPHEADMSRRRDKYFFPIKARVQSLTLGKSLYLTERGYIGLGTHNAKEGDVAVVFLGCNTPMLLRKHDDYYTVVGETYSMFCPGPVKGLLYMFFSARIHGREGYRNVEQW
jgi:heterokaryon incompatibility protein (HET)